MLSSWVDEKDFPRIPRDIWRYKVIDDESVSALPVMQVPVFMTIVNVLRKLKLERYADITECFYLHGKYFPSVFAFTIFSILVL